ncbi:uncharacterized protein ACLA_062060 [Aspergillus clavatus NRRL 1]|uniref:Uncharacterized protein n=1 Tax=Aspergillus clavatus (strain ATCC 1007 / CBS 513.65 / DSM 816 / NCTC 3887 / NRRL 1 / QM 1276 / 107) TaxID=344612 RepID=A1CCI6_ASPCL|nr:uncharacterized protein ACLA_062060 [Aspergillus clavatus NRRL 1]EAW12243.1 hypothetical protein ACLA_062060 [Aspergillus clavatus NRRL 1]
MSEYSKQNDNPPPSDQDSQLDGDEPAEWGKIWSQTYARSIEWQLQEWGSI